MTLKRVMAPVMAPLLAAATLLFAPAMALAQQFEKVEGAVHQEIPAGRFVSFAYGFIWIAILAYVFFVARGLSRVDKELTDLRRKLNAGAPPRHPGA